MSNQELFQALNMFKEGVKELQFSRALDDANSQVAQIKATETDEQKQRAQMQGVSNQLVMQMARFGVPATTQDNVKSAIMPQFKDANAMSIQANLTGNKSLAEQAAKQQSFEQNPQYQIEKIKAKGLMSALNSSSKEEENKKKFSIKTFEKFSEDLDETKASSRSGFGKWADTEQRGARLRALLGDPSKWQNLTNTEFELMRGGLVQLSEGKAITESEHKAMSQFTLAVKKAEAEFALTGKPVSLNMPEQAQLYLSIIDREDSKAKERIRDIVLKRASGNLKKSELDESQFKLTVAKSLEEPMGRRVSPDEIRLDKKKGVYLDTQNAKQTDAPPIVQVGIRNGKTIKYIVLPNGKAQEVK